MASVPTAARGGRALAGAARAPRAVGAWLARAWEQRPDWSRDRAVLGLGASLRGAAGRLLPRARLPRAPTGRGATSRSTSSNAALAGGQITELELRDEDAVAVGKLRDGSAFSVAYPASDAVTGPLVDKASAAGARVSVDRQSTKQAIRIATTFLLPLMILANLFALLFLASRAGGVRAGRRRDVRDPAQGQEGLDAGLDASDVRGRGRRRGGRRGAWRGRRLPEGPQPLRVRGRGPAQGSAALRPAGLRQDAARARRRGRGRRRVLLRRRRRVRRVARRRRRRARARPLRPGARRRAGDRLHRRARRGRAPARHGRLGRRVRRARAHAQPAADRDRRLRGRLRARRHRRHEPARHPRPRRPASRPVRPPHHRWTSPTTRAGCASSSSTRAASRWRPTSTSKGSPGARPASRARTWRT